MKLVGCKYVYREQFTIFSYGLYICSDILQIFDIGFSVFIIASTMIFDLFVAIGLVKRTLVCFELKAKKFGFRGTRRIRR